MIKIKKIIDNFIFGVSSLFINSDISFDKIERKFPFSYKEDSEKVFKDCWQKVFDVIGEIKNNC